ncbi:MAG: exodeoxyribonuclease VII small subunit [Candidatus Omnitrophota bacterium]|nr:exodeoxyribonuclease VII small subunit [Candidatus Omnitrophota bacterium]MDP3786180.1 exodeoxyribonuclease VII small subunit [Candidatus Omnitrophota bacterium]
MTAEMKFEDALKKLEKIVADLESGDLSLDDSLKKYEEGVKLAQFCSKKLESARKKVEILVKSGSGKLETRPYEDHRIPEE